jgi:uncharacterized membrane protein
MLSVQIALGLHVLAGGVFVGCNVLLERVVHRLDAIPPREAARMGELIGTDIIWINFAALAIVALSGSYLMWGSGTLGQVVEPQFYLDGYGLALGLMILLWMTLVVTSLIITFWLRPRLLVKLPYDTSREALEEIGNQAMRANTAMSWLGRYNLVAGVVSILIGGFIRYGGF